MKIFGMELGGNRQQPAESVNLSMSQAEQDLEKTRATKEVLESKFKELKAANVDKINAGELTDADIWKMVYEQTDEQVSDIQASNVVSMRMGSEAQADVSDVANEINAAGEVRVLSPESQSEASASVAGQIAGNVEPIEHAQESPEKAEPAA
jgi:hypothetical protein